MDEEELLEGWQHRLVIPSEVPDMKSGLVSGEGREEEHGSSGTVVCIEEGHHSFRQHKVKMNGARDTFVIQTFHIVATGVLHSRGSVQPKRAEVPVRDLKLEGDESSRDFTTVDDTLHLKECTSAVALSRERVWVSDIALLESHRSRYVMPGSPIPIVWR